VTNRLARQKLTPLLGWSGVAAAAAVAARFAVDDQVGVTAVAILVACVVGVVALLPVRRDRADSADDDAARTILAAFPEAVVAMENGVIIAANRKLCSLFGADRTDVLGMCAPYDFWPPEHRHEHEDWLQRLDEVGSAEAELTIRRRDGQRIPVLASGSSLPARPGRPTTQVVSFRDISERRRVEDRLAELASRDPLTELLNEWGFQERLGEEVARAQAARRALSIVLIQFDGLATQGDLAAVISRFRADLRAGEQISRTNETELAWILPEVEAAGAVAAVERAVSHLGRASREGLAVPVISAGVCELGNAPDAAVLYAFADRALKAARAQGGGTVVYTPELSRASLV
jgi:PAS domain S-box-containing protein